MPDIITDSDRLAMATHALTADRFTSGPKVAEFEEAWSQWLGAKHSLFVSSGSTANFLLVASIMNWCDIKPGDEILVPACTWTTNISPLIQLGLKPVFADISFDRLSFDLQEIDYIKSIHPDIKMVFFTHLLGFPSISDAIREAWPYAIHIDDVCEAQGAKIGEVKVGAESPGATFSFYYGHHMTTIEGGMISTNNKGLYDMMRMKRSHGLARESIRKDYWESIYPDMNSEFLFITDGYNFRNTEMAAVLGLSQLSRVDNSINIRSVNYFQFLEIMDQHRDRFIYPPGLHGSSNFAFPLIAKQAEARRALARELGRENIEYRPIIGGNLLRQPAYSQYKICTRKKIPNADILHFNGLYVGNNQTVTESDIGRLEEVLNRL